MKIIKSLVVSSLPFLFAKKVFAQNQITNPAINTIITQNPTPGAGLAFYIAQMWKTAVTVGGLAFLLYLVWGGIEWMMAGGDKGKIEVAQNKITNALIGLALLVGSFSISLFIQGAFHINILSPELPVNY